MASKAERSELARLMSKCLAYADCGKLDDAYDYADELTDKLAQVLSDLDDCQMIDVGQVEGARRKVGHV